MSSAGRWQYHGLGPAPYGDDTTYVLGAKFLDGLAVEDWGCGRGWFRRFHTGGYIGIDGSRSDFSDVVADLTKFRSQAEAIFMRHVLEHESDWRLILQNAVDSFQKRMFLAVFTPLEKADRVMTTIPTVCKHGIPEIALCEADLHRILLLSGAKTFIESRVESKTRYGSETIFSLEK